MSTTILAALRTRTQLHGNTFLIATEIAHRMNGSGYVRMAYAYIAVKAHCCERTAMRQVARLVEEYGVFRKYVFRTKYGNAMNLYQYRGTIPHRASPPVTTQGDTVSSSLPDPEREKDTALRQDLEHQRKGLRFLTNPDSPGYQACLEKITALEALQQCT